VGIFYIHLTLLNQTGPGDGFYSSAYQISLKGIIFHDFTVQFFLVLSSVNFTMIILFKGNYLHSASTPKEVAYGAILSLKNAITSGGYLHSHDHLYPVGVGATQVLNKNTANERTNAFQIS